LFYLKTKIHFLEKICGKDNWTGCSLTEYTRLKALRNAVIALQNHLKSWESVFSLWSKTKSTTNSYKKKFLLLCSNSW